MGFPKVSVREHLTEHFGLVSDFLGECWNKLRTGSRLSVLQGRVNWGRGVEWPLTSRP